MTDFETLVRVFRLFEDLDGFWWRTDGEYAPVTLFVNCNDFFWWASGDCERVLAENIAVLEEAFQDIDNASDEHIAATWAPLLFVARLRKMRPQGAYYKHIPEVLHVLFDACGPAREAGLGNPVERE